MFGFSEIRKLPQTAESGDSAEALFEEASKLMDQGGSTDRSKLNGGAVEEPPFLDFSAGPFPPFNSNDVTAGVSNAGGASNTDETGNTGEDRTIIAKNKIVTAKPDGVEILDPDEGLRMEGGLKRGELQIDEFGKITDVEGEDVVDSNLPVENPVHSAIRTDGTLESVKFNDTAGDIRQIFNFGPDGNIESLSEQFASDGIKLTRFDGAGNANDGSASASVTRDGDGDITSFSLRKPDASTNQTFRLDKNGDVLGINTIGPIMETQPGGKQEFSGIQTSEAKFLDGSAVLTEIRKFDDVGKLVAHETDNGFSKIKQSFDEEGNVTAFQLRNPEFGLAFESFPGGTNSIMVDADGKTIRVTSFDDGTSESIFSDPVNNETTITQKWPDGSTFRSHETAEETTIVDTDATGNWESNVTDKASRITRRTRGDSSGTFEEAELLGV